MSDSAHSLLSDVTLAILAGGAGSRMGKAKGSLVINGRPILEHLLAHIDWPGQTMLVTAPGREHPPGSQLFDQEVQDPLGGGGPLRGILTALEHLKTPVLAVMPIDMPDIRKTHLAFLVNEIMKRQKCLGLFMRRKSGSAPQAEPFPTAFRRSALDTIRDRLNAEQGSVQRLSEVSGFELIDRPGEWPSRIWTNLNSPADLATYTSQRSDFPSGI
jgi:molybdopterin-guanine dinucleotide biosynthesis protein A